MQVVVNVKRSFRTTGSEVVALYRWSLEQVPLYLETGKADRVL